MFHQLVTMQGGINGKESKTLELAVRKEGDFIGNPRKVEKSTQLRIRSMSYCR